MNQIRMNQETWKVLALKSLTFTKNGGVNHGKKMDMYFSSLGNSDIHWRDDVSPY